jgi:hypothetical protein
MNHHMEQQYQIFDKRLNRINHVDRNTMQYFLFKSRHIHSLNTFVLMWQLTFKLLTKVQKIQSKKQDLIWCVVSAYIKNNTLNWICNAWQMDIWRSARLKSNYYVLSSSCTANIPQLLSQLIFVINWSYSVSYVGLRRW